MNIKIIPQVTLGAKGLERTYGVVIDNHHLEFHTWEEVKSFFKGLNKEEENGTND